jgi:PAS domain S-box-containing protein
VRSARRARTAPRETPEPGGALRRRGEAPLPDSPDLVPVLEAVRAGILVTDGRGTAVFANASVGVLLGVEPAAVLGRPLSETLPEVGAFVGECLRTGEVQRDCQVQGERARVLGEIVPVLRGPEVRGAVFTFRDEAELDRMARRLDSYKLLYDELATIFHTSHDGLWIVDRNGHVVNLNEAAEKLNGVRAQDLIGKHVRELVSSGVIDTSVTEAVLRTRRQASMIQHARRSGKKMLVTGTPSLDGHGDIAFVVINDRDVTELSALAGELEEAKQINARFQEELETLKALDSAGREIVAESTEMRSTLAVALKLARRGVSNILILGESGTGKGLLANFIHQNSDRRGKPFVQINCAALPENLLEAELFGYEKGAFTGARDEGKAGLIELAQGGTLFLDEIGDMPFSVQAKLLKYLDDHEIRRLGGTRAKVVPCAVVAATNQDLGEQVQKKRFRHDLFYRLNTFTLKLVPLRERPVDILPLAHYFLRKYNRLYETLKRLSHGAADRLAHHPFPGNVRELESLVKNAVVMSEGDLLDLHVPSAPGAGPAGAEGSPPGGSAGRNLALELGQLEKRLLQEAAEVCSSTREIAAFLGTSQATVVRKLHRHGIAPSRRGAA